MGGARLLVLMLGALLGSCQMDVGEDDAEPVATREQAVEQSLSMSMTLPASVDVLKLAVGAKQALTARDRVRLEGVAATGNGAVTVTSDARIRSIVARGAVTIGARTRIEGDIRASGTVTRSPSSIVTGTVQAGVNLGAPKVTQWTFPADSVSLGPVSLEQDQVRDLPVGTYGDLTVKSRARLTLHTGAYLFENITLEPEARLLVDSTRGPVQVYLKKNLTFRGMVQTATIGIPQLLVGKLGTGSALVEAPFDGVLVAPDADVRIQAATPRGHRAVFYGGTLTMEPDTIVDSYPFDWSAIVPTLVRPVVPTLPPHVMPRSSVSTAVSVDRDGQGNPTSTETPGRTIDFNLPATYPVAGGIIGNGTVTFTFRTPAGQTITCTYRGGSPTATPSTPVDLNLGRVLTFQSCSDNLPATTARQGTHFTTTVTPSPGYPVTVTPPVVNDKGCSEKLEVLTLAETTQMRQSFDWNNAQTLPERNADGSHALYYAWVFVRSPEDMLNLRKLYIHVLGRPLFTEELARFAGKCGTFSDPGDGDGAFVPVLVGAAVYNRLIAALTNDQIQGERRVFEAFIIRSVPAAARNPNGSVRLDVLANSGFRYLHYEPRPLANSADMQLDFGSVGGALVDVMTFVVEGARNVGEFFTGKLADLDRLLRGSVTISLQVGVINPDRAFNDGQNPIMTRGWGTHQGRRLGALGLEVSILQSFSGTPIPTLSQGNLSFDGEVTIDAVQGASARGTGLCIELKSDAARISGFLTADHLCDLRGFEVDPSVPGTIGDFRLTNFNDDDSLELRVQMPQLSGMYQADDVYQWSRLVLGFVPEQARILTGYWADTFSERDANDPTRVRLWAPCASFTGISDAALTASIGTGLLLALIPVVGPVLGGLTATVGVVFGTTIGQTDIAMAENSAIQDSRNVMSHEYGHYLFCSMLNSANEDAVDHVVWSNIGSEDQRGEQSPPRYTNEAFADFVAGQVTGGANYGWLNPAVDSCGLASCLASNEEYCVPPATTPPLLQCFDTNLRGVGTAARGDARSIGRVATLFHDAFDGGDAFQKNLMNNADVWGIDDRGTPANAADDLLGPTTTSYGAIGDSALERVRLPAASLATVTTALAQDLLPVDDAGPQFSDERTYRAVGRAMRGQGVRWCDRCRVLALHSPNLPAMSLNVRGMFAHCASEPLMIQALEEAPPEPDLRLDADDCTPCPTGFVSNTNGACEFCSATVVGNDCVVCAADVVIDASTLDQPWIFDPTVAIPGDTCPDVFWVEVRNPQVLGDGLVGNVRPVLTGNPSQDLQRCTRQFELLSATQSGASFVTEAPTVAQGLFECAGGICCQNTPRRVFAPAALSSGAPVRFGVRTDDPTIELVVRAAIDVE
jgi:hypothetical protein